jgi:hypothetical protein
VGLHVWDVGARRAWSWALLAMAATALSVPGVSAVWRLRFRGAAPISEPLEKAP